MRCGILTCFLLRCFVMLFWCPCSEDCWRTFASHPLCVLLCNLQPVTYCCISSFLQHWATLLCWTSNPPLWVSADCSLSVCLHCSCEQFCFCSLSPLQLWAVLLLQSVSTAAVSSSAIAVRLHCSCEQFCYCSPSPLQLWAVLLLLSVSTAAVSSSAIAVRLHCSCEQFCYCCLSPLQLWAVLLLQSVSIAAVSSCALLKPLMHPTAACVAGQPHLSQRSPAQPCGPHWDVHIQRLFWAAWSAAGAAEPEHGGGGCGERQESGQRPGAVDRQPGAALLGHQGIVLPGDARHLCHRGLPKDCMEFAVTRPKIKHSDYRVQAAIWEMTLVMWWGGGGEGKRFLKFCAELM